MGMGIVLQQMSIIFILIACGFALYKTGRIADETSKQLSGLVTNVCNPAVVIISVLDKNITITRRDVLFMMLLSVIIYMVLIFLGVVFSRILGIKDECEKKAYQLMTVYDNLIFIGIPLTSAVLGAEALIYVVIFTICYNVLIYTHGVWVLVSGTTDKKKLKFDMKSFLNVGTVSGVIAVFLFWFDVSLPYVVSESLSRIGQCTTFLSMLVLGVSIAKIKVNEVFQDVRLYVFTGIRQIAIPIVFGLVLRLIIQDQLMVNVITLLLAMPVGNMPLILAQQYRVKSDMLSKGIMLTTMLSLFTITIVATVMIYNNLLSGLYLWRFLIRVVIENTYSR